jgi:hypothetical protein
MPVAETSILEEPQSEDLKNFDAATHAYRFFLTVFLARETLAIHPSLRTDLR